MLVPRSVRYCLRFALLAAFLTPLAAPVARAQTISQSFTQSTATGWTLANSTYLTVPTIDVAGSGWLRLTDAVTYETGTALYTGGSFTPIQTLVMQFDYATWGGNGADGITLFLYDATKTMSGAAYGGGLGYCGGAGGYLAIGLDEYGNFSNPGDRCGSASGGPGAQPQKLVIRGPQSASNIYITNTSVPGNISTNAKSRPAANTVFVTLAPATPIGYTLTVQFRQGPTGTIQTLLTGVKFPYAPPASLRIGFSAGTGGSDNAHEVRNFTVLATAIPDHFAVSTAGSAVNCQPAPVTITAHNSSHAAVADTVTIALTTSTGHGDWALASGGGTFLAGPSNSGTASYTYVASDLGVVNLTLRDTVPETVTIGASSGGVSTTSGSALPSEDLPLTFAPSGFRITNGANVATQIGTHVAGLSSAAGSGAQTLALQAIRTDTNTGACTTAFASGTTINMSLGYQCNNPSSCVSGQTLAFTNNGTTTNLAANGAASVTNYTTRAVTFSTANAEAPFTLNYSDVGQISLFAKYSIPLANGTASASTMTGSAQFVVQPAGFAVTNVHCTNYAAGSCNTALGAPGLNPGATGAGGPWLAPAGAPFTATVTAVGATGAATPNFGQEISPATVMLTPNVVLPSGGHDAALTNAASLGGFQGGSVTGTQFSWSEVGILSLTPSIATGSYLGSGNVSGPASANIGRFIPASFATSLNTPMLATACTAGNFSYVGQALNYAVPPVITATALASDGVTKTQNYTGAFFRLTNASLGARTYAATPASPALVTSGLPDTSQDPAIADLGTGQGSLTFSSGSGLSFLRGSPIAPFNADITLAETLVDADGVAATSNPLVFGAASGIAFTAGANQLYGRLALRPALGSELIDLPMSLTTQYYLNGTQGYTTNTGDSCTSAPALAFSNYQLNLHNLTTRSMAASAIAGQFNLVLAAPGAGNAGAATVTATGPSWLQASPTALATFGVFPGPASRIYQRETY
jgi:MSHA biogenesis protein MshQ